MARLAWAAGVIETRGKVRRVDNLQRKTVQLILQVQTRHVHIVERLCALTGVEPRIHEARQIRAGDRRGCVEHCPEAHVHLGVQMPRMAMWAVTGVGAAIVLHNVAPFLHPSTSLSVVDEILDTAPIPADWRKPGRGARAIWVTVNRLRTIGWTIPEPLTVIPRAWIAEG